MNKYEAQSGFMLHKNFVLLPHRVTPHNTMPGVKTPHPNQLTIYRVNKSSVTPKKLFADYINIFGYNFGWGPFLAMEVFSCVSSELLEKKYLHKCINFMLKNILSRILTEY